MTTLCGIMALARYPCNHHTLRLGSTHSYGVVDEHKVNRRRRRDVADSLTSVTSCFNLVFDQPVDKAIR